MSFTEKEKVWFENQIQKYDKKGELIELMYFTHSNLVRFMIEVIDLDGLTTKIWNESTHPENRLPYVIDITVPRLIQRIRAELA